MALISFQKLGKSGESPRLWVESRRLESFGFRAGTPFSIQRYGLGVQLRPALISSNHVSERRAVGRKRPIIDVASRIALAPLVGYAEIKVLADFGRINAVPSARAFHIARGVT